MKKFLISLIILVSSMNFLAAQVTYTYNDGVWNIGDSVKYYLTDWTSAGPSGAAQLWDFSFLANNGLAVDSILTPSNTPYSSNYPTAQVAQVNTLGWGFFTQSSSDLQSLGSANSNTYVVYTDPWKFRSYPMEYETNWTDSFSGSGFSGPDGFTTSGICHDTIDGWGTLELPSGSISSVLRLHSTAKYSETYVSGVHQHTWETYEWYAPELNRALLVFHRNIDSLNSQQFSNVTYAAWLDTIFLATSIKEVASRSLRISIEPNPNMGKFSISLSTPSPEQRATIEVLNEVGQVVLNDEAEISNGILKKEIELPSVSPAGIYLVRVKCGEEVYLQKLIIQR